MYQLNFRVLQFYNPPGWPGVLPLGQANDMCINTGQVKTQPQCYSQENSARLFTFSIF